MSGKKIMSGEERARLLRAAGFGDELIQESLALSASLAALSPDFAERMSLALRASCHARRLVAGMILEEHAHDGWRARRRLKKDLRSPLSAPSEHLKTCGPCRAWVAALGRQIADITVKLT